jgi:phosphate transport system substrate-binding protein
LINGFLRCAAVSAALGLFALPGAAQDVTLTSRDGTLSISGMFQGYDGEVFRVMTDYGLLTVDGEGVVCDGPACPDLTSFVADVRVVGEADAGRRMLPPLLSAFAAARGFVMTTKEATFVLAEPTTGRVVARFAFEPRAPETAAEAVRLGVADLALAATDQPDLSALTLGLEALVAVVSPQNPVRSLATADLARALSGQISNWQDLGGPDMPVVVHALKDGTGFRSALEARLGQAVVATELHDTQEGLDAAVGRDPWALAVTTGSSVLMAQVLTLTDSCGFALSPTTMAVRAGDYPLTLPFFVLAPKRRLPLVAREFLEFLEAPGSQPAIAEAGLIDRQAERAALLADGQRLANAIRALGPDVPVEEVQRLAVAMAGAERLSLTFRYKDGGQDLDAASQGALAALVRLIETGGFSDMDLTFAAFSEGGGDGTATLAQSQQRADALLEAVAAAVPDLGDLRVTLRSQAFGDALPIACDESPIGRQLNRRVEVWLRPSTGSAAP